MLGDELGDAVSVGAVTVGHSAKPVRLQRSLLHLFLRRQRLPIGGHLRDKDRVLVDLRRACSTYVSSCGGQAVLLYNETAGGGLVHVRVPILLHKVAGSIWDALRWNAIAVGAGPTCVRCIVVDHFELLLRVDQVLLLALRYSNASSCLHGSLALALVRVRLTVLLVRAQVISVLSVLIGSR